MNKLFEATKCYSFQATLDVYNEDSEKKSLSFCFHRHRNTLVVETRQTIVDKKIRKCPFNMESHIPCQCHTETYEKCMGKNACFVPTNEKVLFNVIYMLAHFENKFEEFTEKEIVENNERFQAIFKYDENEIIDKKFKLIEYIGNKIKYECEGKTYVFKIYK